MKWKKIKKNIKTNLIIGFIIALIIMVRAAWKKGSLVCGLTIANLNCPIYIWIIQLLIFALLIFILIGLIVLIVKLLLKSIKKRKSSEKEEEYEEEKEEHKKAVKKHEKAKLSVPQKSQRDFLGKAEKKTKKEKSEGITLENGDKLVEKWPDEDEVIKI